MKCPCTKKNLVFSLGVTAVNRLKAPRWASHQGGDQAGFLLDGEPIATEQLHILYVIVAEEAELDFT